MELIWVLVFTGEFTIKTPASIVQDKKPEPGSEKTPWLGSEVNYKESVAFYCTKYIRRGIIHYDLLTQSDLG